MSRTTREIDDRLIGPAMSAETPDEAESDRDALRRLVGTPMTREEMLAMHGTGWDGDLDAMRSAPLPWDR